MTRLVLVACALAGVLASSSIARAQDDTHHTDEVTLEDDAARGLYDVASAHYAAGRLEEAAHEFEEAYRLSHRPLLLYNAYIAYRDANLRADAARTLRAYLESGTEDARRPNLEARLTALETELHAESQHAEETTETTEAEPPPVEASPPPPPPQRSHDLANVVAPILIGVGGAMIVAAAITGGLALSKHDELAAACPGGTCDASRQGDIDTLGTLALTTDVVGGIGIAAAIVGVVVLAVDLSSGSSDAPPTASVSCGPLGCSVAGVF